MVTMMWEKNFLHISYLATDEFLDETPVMIPDHVGRLEKT